MKSDRVKHSVGPGPISASIAVAGTGRMGKGIALAFAYAGYPVSLIDSEEREDKDFDQLRESATAEIDDELSFLTGIKVITVEQAAATRDRVSIFSRTDGIEKLKKADFIFEAVLELEEIKKSVYNWLNAYIQDTAIVSSTTSTMSADMLSGFVSRRERFVNGHWLNPAHLMPLVEVSPGSDTDQQTVEKFKSLLAGIGKVPVVCKASPGFIVSRIQALALNEATRLVEEGVASAEDIDKAIKTGFGIRYATLGLLEFIDWGGGDILYHATNYLGEKIDKHRFSVTDLVKENMKNNKNGLRDGIGFYDWQDCDLDLYRKGKLTELIKLLEHQGLMPQAEVYPATGGED